MTITLTLGSREEATNCEIRLSGYNRPVREPAFGRFSANIPFCRVSASSHNFCDYASSALPCKTKYLLENLPKAGSRTGLLYPDDGAVGVKVPDLPGCFTFGKNKAEVLLMAKDAVEMWLWDAENKHEPIPRTSDSLSAERGETLTWIAADTDEYRRSNDTRAIKKTLSIPAWLNYQAEKANAPFSQILQQGLKEYLRVSE